MFKTHFLPLETNIFKIQLIFQSFRRLANDLECNVTGFLLDLLKISRVTGLVITCNIIITSLIYYLFLFSRSCIYLIVVCVCMSVCERAYTVSV